MKNFEFFLFCFTFLSISGYAQDENLFEIINADTTIEIGQQKIDSLLKIYEQEMAPKLLADCYHDLGLRWYYTNWDGDKNDKNIKSAIAHTEKALNLKKKLDSLEEGSLEKTMYNLGYFHFSNEKYYDAINAYLDLAKNGKDFDKVQSGNRELGKIYEIVGDFYKALNRYDEFISFYKNEDVLVKKEILNLAEIYILKAEIFSLLGYREFSNEIEDNLILADSILREVDYKNQLHLIRINSIRGSRFTELGDYSEAIYHYNEVLKDSLLLDSRNLSKAFNMLSIPQLELKEYGNCLNTLKEAISFDPDYPDPYENLGDLYLAQNEFGKAMLNYQKAIVWAIGKKKTIDFKELPAIQDLELATEKVFLLGHIVAKANGWLKYYEYDNNRGYLDHALKTFALADQLVDIIRSESTEQQSKLFWREKGASLYTKAVEVCYLLDKPEEAYYFMERNKALLLLEDISNEQAKEITKLPNAMAEREFELKRAIFLSENDFKNFDTASPNSLESVKRDVYKNKRIYNTFVDSLAKAFPEYANIKKKVDVLPYSDFKTKYISEDEVVLQYILNGERGYGLLTTENETVFFKLAAVEALNEKIITLYGQLTDMTTNRDEIKVYNTLSHQVFKQLVPEKVHKKINGKKLILVTDYILQQIPFEAFVVTNETDTYLIEETEIRYAYSMSYLEAKKRVSSTAKKELYAVAPVQFASLGLPELLFSRAEVGEAEKIFSGEVVLNGEATKSRFIENLDDTKILHLSTHADIGDGADPWIAFSDGKMFLNEIYATKNQAEMVVLSACNTSVGELRKGEGAMSLARGFFHSGAKSVVSSLWSTNDKSSKELMTAFYKGLDKGLTKAEALRKAKIDYINQYRGTMISPSYWAPLIVIGDNSPMTNSTLTGTYLPWVIIGLSLFLLLGFFFFKRRKIHSNS